MNDPKPHPSPLLRKAALVTRWALIALALVWLLFLGTAGVLHGFIVPRIGDYRGQLEQAAARALGVPVQIGEITAHSDGLLPNFQLSNVSLKDAQGREALHLAQVDVVVSARSVWRGGVEQIVLLRPQLDVRRRSDGVWEVAGFAQQPSQDSDGRALQWLLKQPEIAIRDGALRWEDELEGTGRQVLTAVDVTLRNRHWRHDMQLQARSYAPDGRASQLQVQAQLREAVLALGKAPWERWHGQVFISGEVAQLPNVPLPAQWRIAQLQTQGAVRIWADIRQGSVSGVTADVQLPTLQVLWQGEAAPLTLQRIQGRAELQAIEGAWRSTWKGLTFEAADGVRWPATDAVLSWPQSGQAKPFVLEASHVDLPMLQAISAQLPLPAEHIAVVKRWKVQGALADLRVQWQPALPEQQARYSAQGTLKKAAWSDASPPSGSAERPEFQGLDATFVLDEQSGSAQLGMQRGSLSFPSIFEEPRIPIDALQAQLRWSRDAQGRWVVEVPRATFANVDAQGHAKAHWKMGESAAARLPGVLELEGVLTRANGARVHRYLPLTIPAQARHYVRDSVRQGQGKDVRFQVSGPLAEFPFDAHAGGVFHIAAPVKEVVFDYAPASVLEAGQAPWPVITRLAGELVFDKAGMQVRQAQGWFGAHAKAQMKDINASIADLSNPVLHVTGQGTAPLSTLLDITQRSALASLTDHALSQVKASGMASLKLDLHLPIEALETSRVKGVVGLLGAQLRFRPDIPELQQARGAVHFSENGFSLQSVQAQALGGPVKLTGGLQLERGEVALDIRAQGRATAHGLQADGFLPVAAEIARHATGAADYEVQVGMQRAVPQIVVRSNLQGMALELPAPLGKSAADTTLLHVHYGLTPQAAADADAPLQTMLQVHARGLGAATYVFDAQQEEAPLTGGFIQLGGALDVAGEWPSKWQLAPGVQAYAELPVLDVDAWRAWWARVGGEAPAASRASVAAWGYVPSQLSLKVGRLQAWGRQLDEVVAGVSHHEGVWQGNLTSRQLGGHVRYQAPNLLHSQGQVFARLSHLVLQQATAAQANDWLDAPIDNMPALDVQVQSFTVGERPLGQLTVKAHNSRHEGYPLWMLKQLDLALPEATLRAHGTWGGPDAARRYTQLQFELALKDSGKLLARFAMPDVLKGGHGNLHGALRWPGAPIAPNWHSMSGSLHLEVGEGQFLKAEPGLAKLLSVLSLQALPRRIGLDFRDVFSSGFAFDFVRGDVAVQQGVARTNNLQMKGVNAAVLMEGQASLPNETQQLRVVVVPEINAMTASLVATVINPVVGLGSFLAQALMRGPLAAAATREFEISGSWSDPQVQVVQRSWGEPQVPVPSEPDPSNVASDFTLEHLSP